MSSCAHLFNLRFCKGLLFTAALLALLVGHHGEIAALFARDAQPVRQIGLLAFAAFLVVRDRRALAASSGAPSLICALAIPVFTFLGLVGLRGEQPTLAALSLLGSPLALVGAFFGWRTLREILFPAAFVALAFPLVQLLNLDRLIAFRMRELALSVAMSVADGCGFPLVRDGALLRIPGSTTVIDLTGFHFSYYSAVGAPTLAAVFAALTQRTLRARILLVALAVPSTAIGNAVRFLALFTAFRLASPDLPSGLLDGRLGTALVLAVSLAPVVAAGLLIRKGGSRPCARS